MEIRCTQKMEHKCDDDNLDLFGNETENDDVDDEGGLIRRVKGFAVLVLFVI